MNVINTMENVNKTVKIIQEAITALVMKAIN